MNRIRRRHAQAGLALCLSVGVLIGAAPSATAGGTAPGYPGSNVQVAVTGLKTAGHLIYIVASGSNRLTSLGTPINYGLYVILVNQKLLPGPCSSSMETDGLEQSTQALNWPKAPKPRAPHATAIWYPRHTFQTRLSTLI